MPRTTESTVTLEREFDYVPLGALNNGEAAVCDVEFDVTVIEEASDGFTPGWTECDYGRMTVKRLDGRKPTSEEAAAVLKWVCDNFDVETLDDEACCEARRWN